MGLNKALVVIPTTGAEVAADAIKSVLAQTVPTDLLLVCDGEKFRKDVESMVEEFHDERITVCYLPYNTGGGGFYGHRIMAGFAHLIPHDYVLFLDQDNWFEPDHVDECIKEIERYSFDFVYSLRKVSDQNGHYVCNDDCESLGRWPAWVNEQAFLVDTSSYCYKTEFFNQVSYLWHHGWGADRRFFTILKDHFKHKNFGCTGKYTLNYRCGGNEGSVQPEFFLQGNAKMKEKYPGNYVLDWKYDPSVMKMVLIPIFENSHEETFWKLKYSNL